MSYMTSSRGSYRRSLGSRVNNTSLSSSSLSYQMKSRSNLGSRRLAKEESPLSFSKKSSLGTSNSVVSYQYQNPQEFSPESLTQNYREILNWLTYDPPRIPLVHAKLYTQRLIKDGFDDLKAIYEDIEEDDLSCDSISMAKGHVRRVMKAINDYRVKKERIWQTTNFQERKIKNSFDSVESNHSSDSMSSLGLPITTKNEIEDKLKSRLPSEWTCQDVKEWLCHFEAFRTWPIINEFSEINGQILLQIKDESHLKNFTTLKPPVHKRRLLIYINILRDIERQLNINFDTRRFEEILDNDFLASMGGGRDTQISSSNDGLYGTQTTDTLSQSENLYESDVDKDESGTAMINTSNNFNSTAPSNFIEHHNSATNQKIKIPDLKLKENIHVQNSIEATPRITRDTNKQETLYQYQQQFPNMHDTSFQESKNINDEGDEMHDTSFQESKGINDEGHEMHRTITSNSKCKKPSKSNNGSNQVAPLPLSLDTYEMHSTIYTIDQRQDEESNSGLMNDLLQNLQETQVAGSDDESLRQIHILEEEVREKKERYHLKKEKNTRKKSPNKKRSRNNKGSSSNVYHMSNNISVTPGGIAVSPRIPEDGHSPNGSIEIQQNTETSYQSNHEDQIVLIEEVGHGACSHVFRAVHVPSLTVVAVKHFMMENESKKSQLKKELNIYYNLKYFRLPDHFNLPRDHLKTPRLRDVSKNEKGDDCKHIIGMLETYSASNEKLIVMVLEYMDGGTLEQLINYLEVHNITLEEETIAWIAWQTIQGLKEIHRRRMIHRDIKPANILLQKYGGGVRLGDFGIARFLPGHEDDNSSNKNGLSNDLGATLYMSTFTGTLLYMSPERLQGLEYSTSADIWSFGLCLLTLTQRQFPISNEIMNKGFFTVLKTVEEGFHIEYNENLTDGPSEDLCDLINKCLQVKPENRATAEELLGHKFFQDKKIKLVDDQCQSHNKPSNFEDVPQQLRAYYSSITTQMSGYQYGSEFSQNGSSSSEDGMLELFFNKFSIEKRDKLERLVDAICRQYPTLSTEAYLVDDARVRSIERSSVHWEDKISTPKDDVEGDNNLTLKWANKMDELESTLQLPKGLLKWLWRRQLQDEI